MIHISSNLMYSAVTYCCGDVGLNRPSANTCLDLLSLMLFWGSALSYILA